MSKEKSGMMKQILSVLLVLLSFSVEASLKISKINRHIKVKVGAKKQRVEISGVNLTRDLPPLKKRKKFNGRKTIRFNCSNFFSDNKSKLNGIHLASLSSESGLVSYDNKKYLGKLHVVTSKKSPACDIINEIEIDQYISSLLSKEMNAKWPIEALKAQAVAARTYALHKIEGHKKEDTFYHIENSEKHQVNGDFFDVTKKTIRASRETSGMVLRNNKKKLVPAFFHASCGGFTLKPQDVWSNKVSGYHKHSRCEYCKTKKNWNIEISDLRILKFLKWLHRNKLIKKSSKSNYVKLYPSNKISKIIKIRWGSSKLKVKKAWFRRYFGRKKFSSNNFYIADSSRGRSTFVGKGRGHGVGMCQVGARALALRGWSYKKILKHYFPDLKLTQIY